MTRQLFVMVAVLLLVVVSGCASTTAPRADPLEGLNRVTFKFNDAVDSAVLTPVAKGYQAVTPSFVRAGVSNVFGNVGDVGTAANNLLQFHLWHPGAV
jgi:phospholipid-binding lipoprotein MlaA